VAVGSLVVLSLLVYGLPALFGHPVVPGDDLIQNLPLRELVGDDLRAGRLPVFDPYIWSGAPLLAGWNAGAAYPLTWLFAVMSGTAAWTLNLVAAAACASVGCYAFLRASGLAVVPSWAGAMTFAFGGGMVAQVSHVGFIIGMSWVPLALLALLRLTAPAASTTSSSRLRWAALLAVTVGMVLLSGEPRAVTDGAVVLAIYAAWRILAALRASWRAGAVAAGTVLLGAGAGIGLGAVQILPGLAAVATSQRAHPGAFLFGAGSLPAHWLTLLGVPDLLGGSGSFGQPVFFARYNLTEVTGYVGLLPLVAAVALFARLRRHRPLPQWLVWEVVALAGILLALGDNTLLWHLLIHIPLLGAQRLQSRAILITDLALAVLLACWLDGWVPGASPSATTSGAGGASERALGALPLAGVIGIVVVAFTDGSGLLRWMGVQTQAASHAASLRPWLVPALALAGAALALVITGPRLSPTLRSTLATSFVVVDLLVFSLTAVVAVGRASASSTAPAPSRPVPSSPAVAAARSRSRSGAQRTIGIATMHLSGRFAVYDPGRLYPSQLRALGVPDANALAGTWSVEGYGSIVDGHYATLTGVHGVSGRGQDVFSPRAAADGVLDSLSTQAVLAPAQYFRVPVKPGASAKAGAGGRSGERGLSPGRTTTWFLGGPLAVRSAHLDIRVSPSPGRGARTLVVRVGVLTQDGAIRWARVETYETSATDISATAARVHAVWVSPTDAVALLVDSTLPASAEPPILVDRTGRSYELDGTLQQAMSAPHWEYRGQDGPFAVFFDQRAKPALTLRAPRGGSLRGASVRRLTGPELEPSAAIVSSPKGVDVVRADAAVPGWSASWTPTPSRGAPPPAPKALTVRRLGVVQVVRVPAGRGVLTWRYRAPGLLAGELASAASVALVLVLFVVAARRGRVSRTRSA
jgi:hypothetical protein